MSMAESTEGRLTLVTTKPCFGLPTSCPNCLPAYFYLKFARLPFDLYFHSTFPDSEIYSKASLAYGALSTQLGDGSFLFGDRPSSLDALFLGHTLIALHALPDASVLKSKLVSFSNLVKYAEKLGTELIDGSAQSADPAWSRVPSSEGHPSTSTNKPGGFSNWSSKPKTKPKKERTEEEKKFRQRAKYFLTAQLVSVLVFLSLFGGSNTGEVEFDEDDEGIDYYD